MFTRKLCLYIAIGLTLPLSGYSQSATKATSDAASPWSWGGDIRLRNEFFNNSLTLSKDVSGHEQDCYRIRARLWTSWTPVAPLSFNVRIASEPRVWMESPSYSRQHSGQGTEWRYAIVDGLSVRWTQDIGDSWNMVSTIGRQDIMLGDPGKWWLVADGSPSDGSWTSFFDAARITFENKAAKTKVDLIALQTRSAPDSNLAILGSASTYSMAEQNEKGLILYATVEPRANLSCSGYFIYKHDDKVLSSGDNADIYTLGSRITGTPSEHWSYDVEAAFQWGEKEDASLKWSSAGVGERDISAWGVNANLNYLFKDSLKNKLTLSCEYLSGDDPNTKQDEMFDILWGRYPRWSDSYAFSFAKETGGRIAQMNNLLRIGPSWSVSPTATLNITTSYAILMAPEAAPTRATSPALFSNNGHNRGQLLQLVVSKQFTKHLSGRVCAELLSQGNFYANRDLQSFLRLELTTRF